MSRTQKFFAVLIGLFIFVAVVDFSAKLLKLGRRAFFPRSTAKQAAEEAVRVPDGYERGLFQPGQTNVTLGAYKVTLNSLGFRGPESVRRAKRVVCMGDSVSFGWGASNEDSTYPAFLGKRLAPLDVEVINAAMPGSASIGVLSLYMSRVLPLKPDFVVVMVGWNDIYFVIHPPQKVAVKSLGNMACDIFDTTQILKEAATAARRRSAIQDRVTGSDQVCWERFDQYEAVLRSIVATMRHNGSIPVLMTILNLFDSPLNDHKKLVMHPQLVAWPDLSYDGWKRLTVEANNRIRRVAADLKVPLVDNANCVGGEHFTDMCHLDDKGNELLADRAAKILLEVISRAAGGK
jgi:lysophospholipase L1-like esterase